MLQQGEACDTKSKVFRPESSNLRSAADLVSGHAVAAACCGSAISLQWRWARPTNDGDGQFHHAANAGLPGG